MSNGVWRVDPQLPVPLFVVNVEHRQWLNRVELYNEGETEVVNDSHANQHQTEQKVILMAVSLYLRKSYKYTL